MFPEAFLLNMRSLFMDWQQHCEHIRLSPLSTALFTAVAFSRLSSEYSPPNTAILNRPFSSGGVIMRRLDWRSGVRRLRRDSQPRSGRQGSAQTSVRSLRKRNCYAAPTTWGCLRWLDAVRRRAAKAVRCGRGGGGGVVLQRTPSRRPTKHQGASFTAGANGAAKWRR
jgi:hypothetical protein